MPPWMQSHVYQLPTLDRLKGFESLISRPTAFSRIDDIDSCWKSSLTLFLAHGLHSDGDNLADLDMIHPLTLEHYQSGKSKHIKASDESSMGQWKERLEHVRLIQEAIYDLCTLRDRLTGGTTLVIHHPGATEPSAELVAENLKAEVYIDPCMLIKHPELHAVSAEVVQMFIECFACANAKDFREMRDTLGWSKRDNNAPSPSKAASRIPPTLIPAHSTPLSNRFVIPGSSGPSKGQTKNVPSTPRKITVVTGDNEGQNYPGPGPSTFVIRNSPYNNPRSGADKDFVHLLSPSTSNPAPWPHNTTLASRTRPQIIQSFGENMATIIWSFNLMDKLHRLCFRLAEDFLPDRWVEELEHADGMKINREIAYEIAEAMKRDSDFDFPDYS
ncbi:hypothetical protein BJ138DRAFT_1119867 [Hygrophoropsis aurantiaca]|uniref:Uncharacterized protein n=1 Tax=Hygrophoropsis aurantiaca TaxID=72124 RepID=A0ACB7ZSS7_9AGAM|nr:hypothetical protein BJ138DRAFT_1119867 [Hygrophoropsis aurantiaca]